MSNKVMDSAKEERLTLERSSPYIRQSKGSLITVGSCNYTRLYMQLVNSSTPSKNIIYLFKYFYFHIGFVLFYFLNIQYHIFIFIFRFHCSNAINNYAEMKLGLLSVIERMHLERIHPEQSVRLQID